MKTKEYYTNLYPFENLLPKLDEIEIQEIINNCDYTIESNNIARHEDLSLVNNADAVVFYKMGYDRAISELEKKLK